MKGNIWGGILALLPAIWLGAVAFDIQERPWLLQFDGERSIDIECSENAGYFSFLTIGNNPLISTLPFTSDLPGEYAILSFEYFATDYQDKLKIALVNENGEKRELETQLGIREGWSFHSISLTEIKSLWGKRGDYLQIMPGEKRGYALNIRNLHLRTPTVSEKKREQQRAQKLASEQLSLMHMNRYLSTSFDSDVADVELGKSIVTVSGRAGNQDHLFLAEIPLWMDAYALGEITHLFPIRSGDTFKQQIERFGPTGDDCALSRWMVVRKIGNRISAESNARYVDGIYAVNEYDEEHPANRKGLADFDASRPEMIEDLDSLGITSVNVNFWSREILRSKPDSTTVPHLYGGRLFYINSDWLERMVAIGFEAFPGRH